METITKQEVAKLHATLLTNGKNHDDDTLSIVRIIGGIDYILQDYLHKNNKSLSDKKIIQLHQFLSIPSKYRIKNVSQHTIQKSAENKENLSNKPILILQTTDTFLNSFFGSQIANQLQKLIWHKITLSLMFLIWLIAKVIDIIFSSLFIDIFKWIFSIIHSSWYILTLMSTNRFAASKIIKTFEFWFKIYFCVMGQIARIVYFHVLHTNGQTKATSNVASAVTLLLFFVLVFMFDAIHDPSHKIRKFVIPMILLLGLNYGFYSVLREYFSFSSNGIDPSIITISNSIQISLLSVIANSYRIISIFLIKQSISMYLRIRNGESEKALFIQTKMNLKWNVNTQNQHILNQMQNYSNQSIDELQIKRMDSTGIDEIHIETQNVKNTNRNSFSINVSDM
eukprot:14670_1